MADINTFICENYRIPFNINVIVCVFYILIFLLAIPGNFLVGLVIGFHKQALSPSDLYLLHLALADILLALTLPFWATSITQGWVFGSIVCKVVSFLLEVSFYTSILFLVCISVDRYLVIVRAMEARKASRRLVSWGACGAVWCLGGVLSLPALYNSTFLPPGHEQEVCLQSYDPTTAEKWRLATRALRHILGFLLPLGVMVACYSITIARLLRTRGGFQRQRAMRVIIVVVAAFLFCWMPYHMAVIADTLLREEMVAFDCMTRSTVDRAIFATQSLGLLHSCVNPVLYAFVGEKFRKRLLQELRKKGLLERASLTRASRSSQSSDFISTLM